MKTADNNDCLSRSYKADIITSRFKPTHLSRIYQFISLKIRKDFTIPIRTSPKFMAGPGKHLNA